MKNEVRITLPHDIAVRIYPFSKLPISRNFEKIYKDLYSKHILGELKEAPSMPDIPQYFTYACARSSGNREVNTSYGFGGSDDEKTSIEHSIAEAIEHYCILNETSKKFVQGSYNQLKMKAVDPTLFIPFSKKQFSKKKYKKFRVSKDSFINWLGGYDLTNSKKMLIPASLAYANYSHKLHNEPVIRMPISTGAACGPNLDFAIYKGICEIIERDGYIISFMPEVPKRLISIDKSNKELCKLLNKFNRYNFEVYFFDTTLDTDIFSVVCLLVDRTGGGPAVCCGLGAGLDTTNALKTSAIEALRRYVSNRNKYFYSNSPIPKNGSFEWFNWKKYREWSSPHMIKQVENIIRNSKEIPLHKTVKLKTDKEYLKYTLSRLRKVKCTTYYIDMTIPEVETQGLKIVKVLIPEMVPLWHDERYPYFGIKRLIEIPKRMNIHVNLNINTKELIKIHPF